MFSWWVGIPNTIFIGKIEHNVSKYRLLSSPACYAISTFYRAKLYKVSASSASDHWLFYAYWNLSNKILYKLSIKLHNYSWIYGLMLKLFGSASVTSFSKIMQRNLSRTIFLNHIYIYISRGVGCGNLGVILVRVCESVFQNLPHSHIWPSKKRTHSYEGCSKWIAYCPLARYPCGAR